MTADIIPFPDPNTRKDKDPKKRRRVELVDCFFGNIDLFRLLRDTEKKIVSLRRKKEKDSERSP